MSRVTLACWLSLAAVTAGDAGELIADVSTRADADQSYALYLPPGYTPDSPAPILYCFEPRSRGVLCVELFRAAAKRHGYIIASSNNSRSDGPMEPNIAAMKALWKDTHERLAIDDTRVYATGFSGGARVANIMGQVLGIAGVIAVGGGYPPSAPPRRDIPFDFFALVGEHDFNYYELRRLDRTLDQLALPHRIDVFPGRHQWAPADRCETALEWMELRAMRRELRPVDPDQVGQWWREWNAEAAALEASGRLLRAERRYRSLARDFDGMLDVSAAEAAAERLAGNKDLKRQHKEHDRWDAWGQAYLDRLAEVLTRLRESGGPTPGADQLLRDLEIGALLKSAEERADDEQGRAARRVLEMVRVQTAVTQVQHYFSIEDYARATVCLEVATQIAPGNAVVWYNLACAQAQSGATKKALRSLTRAVDEGFANVEQLRDDPDLDPLRDRPEFAQLADSLTSG